MALERCPYCGMVSVKREIREDEISVDGKEKIVRYVALVCSNKECPVPERIPMGEAAHWDEF